MTESIFCLYIRGDLTDFFGFQVFPINFWVQKKSRGCVLTLDSVLLCLTKGKSCAKQNLMVNYTRLNYFSLVAAQQKVETKY